MTITTLVSGYVLSHDLRPSTAEQYRRIVGVYCSHHGYDVPLSEFTATALSRFLLAKQEAGRSSHYRKSLRNCLIALLRFSGNTERVRPVKLSQLEPEGWTPAEIGRLLDAAGAMYRVSHRLKWQRIIAFAYYTGLGQVDLSQLRREDISAGGIVRTHRSKTGTRVVASIPLELLDGLPVSGLLFPVKSKEAFRATFARIVKAAGLVGTFKKIRKSAGTEAERLHPGRGHELLANTRKVFEAHYWDRREARESPIRPTLLAFPCPDDGPKAA